MFLQKLELQGFKSFVDKTALSFTDGITGVVGPNGCGKTNVSDAIRWVMGEQSAKQLRGDSMEDVIFNGCPSRKPLGMAEVHLTFANDRGILPTEFSEVTISRRVFRSGVSEYSINKTPCRLKDIRDLFFDTGMGSHAYSVIERQMVDQVLSDNSGHRRFLFEEASGITKYKARKKEALNKLDATDTDLTRLNDIVFEIERELRSLARQVGKARRYQRLRDRIKELDLTLTARKVEALQRRATDAAERWQEEAVRREGVTAALDALEARLNDEKLALLELERELATAQGGLRDREETRAQADHQIVLLRERAAGLARRAAEAAEEAARMRERHAEVAEAEREAGTQRAAIRAQLAEAHGAAEACEREVAAVDAELRGRRAVAADRKQLSLDLFSTEADKRGACERARERITLLGERRDAAETRRNELAQRVDELARSAESHAGRRAELDAGLADARARLIEVEGSIETIAAAVHDVESAVSRLRQESAGAESRLATLLELKRNFEGVAEGVKLLLTGPERAEGLLGVVADVLEVPARYLDALEASLGEASAFVLVDGPEALGWALERLRGLESGRATLVDLSSLTAGSLPPLPDEPGVIGRASDLVRCEGRVRALVERLLGSVVMVEDRDTAARLAGQGGGLRFVSLDGEVWERGRVRAGSLRNLGGLLHREMEIRELTGQLAELGLSIEGLEHERETHEARRAQAQRDRAVAQAELDQRRAALETAARELDSLERERRWSADEASERGAEIATLDAERDTLARVLVDAEQELAAFQRELEQARVLLADLDGAVHALETRRDEAGARAHEARESLLRLAREEGEWETRWARAEQTRRELETGLEARAAEERQCRAEVAGLEAEVAGLEAGLAGLVADEDAQRANVAALQSRFQGLKAEVQAGEDEARRKRFEQTELGELTHQIELEKLQLQAELERTYERIRTEHDIDPAAWTPVAPPEDFDPAAAERELEETRERSRTLGAVNLLALEEYEKKRERWQFLVQQRTDLISAKAQLLEAIEKINVTASQLFVETFAKVQGHFREIFATLFEGGDSELRTIGDDPLECEIEIAAKPRGKHLQSISLMSGGERALTAIALLFAIYLVKPSPFCLLDEVDAPLDDANVERFLRMLERFSDRTQFVVITHNKKTMESANCLYGVTMQELGVSTLVSVRFDSAERHVPEPELAEATAG